MRIALLRRMSLHLAPERTFDLVASHLSTTSSSQIAMHLSLPGAS
jgi:hypothetical protein